MQEDLVFRIGEAAIDRVATHLRYHRRILLRLVAPFDFLRIDIEREDLVGERRMQVHGVADDERRTLVTAKHAGGKHPGHLHLAHVLSIDLGELAVTLVVHIAGLHRPVLGVGRLLLDVGIRQRGIRKRESQRECRHPVDPPTINIHTSSYGIVRPMAVGPICDLGLACE